MGFPERRATASTRSIMLGMRVQVECFWGDMVPAYQEVVHYSPNWVTWANKERGLVGGSKACRCIERHLEWQD